jgi:oligoribonuclease
MLRRVMDRDSEARRKAPLVWLDLEMSGLDPERCVILEIATIITDSELRVVAAGPDLVVHQPDHVLEAMDDWCKEQHGKSGLVAAVRASTISLAEAESRTLALVRAHCSERESPLCGNSIAHDRRFLGRYMPALEGYLHYRNIDVSSVKELVFRWYPALEAPPKRDAHRALDDIHESIDELRFYRNAVFRRTAPEAP